MSFVILLNVVITENNSIHYHTQRVDYDKFYLLIITGNITTTLENNCG